MSGAHIVLGTADPWIVARLAAQRLPHLSWLFVGPIAGSPAIRDWVRRMQALPNCRFVGELPYDQLAAVHAGIDIAVLPYGDGTINPCEPGAVLLLAAVRRAHRGDPGCRQLDEYRHLLHLCDDPEAFIDTLARLADVAEDPTREQRWALARCSTWEARVKRSCRRPYAAASSMPAVRERQRRPIIPDGDKGQAASDHRLAGPSRRPPAGRPQCRCLPADGRPGALLCRLIEPGDGQRA